MPSSRDSIASRRYLDDAHATYYAERRWIESRHARATDRWEQQAVATFLDRAGITAEQPADRILDIPCGAGRFSPVLEPRCRVLWQSDRAAPMLLHRQHSSPWCCQASLLALPAADQVVDLVFTFRVLHHFPRRQDRIQVLSELARVSRNWVLTSWFDAHSFPVCRDRLRGRRREMTPLSRRAFEAEAAAAGLEVVEHRYRRRGLSKQVLCLLRHDNVERG